MTGAEKLALQDAVSAINNNGREAAEYLVELLDKEDNTEASEWLTVNL